RPEPFAFISPLEQAGTRRFNRPIGKITAPAERMGIPARIRYFGRGVMRKLAKYPCGMAMVKGILTVLCLVLSLGSVKAQFKLKLAKLKYNGGGDWYANKTALPNLIEFCGKELGIILAPEEDIVEASSRDIF